MTYFCADGTLGVQLNEVGTTQLFPLGKIVTGRDEDGYAGEFIYLLGVGSTALGSWVTYNMDDGSTGLATANAIGPVAIAMGANGASSYGWYQIGGKASGLCLASFADNASCYLTATAGSIDDASVAGDYIRNAKGASAIDSATCLADFEIARPYVDNGLTHAAG